MRFLILLMFLPLFLHGQKHDYTWVLGSDGQSLGPDYWSNTLNFNDNPIEKYTELRPMYISSCQTHISDEEGNLLYYSNGCYFRSANGEVMENGMDINPGVTHDNYCDDGYPSSMQSMISIPAPSQPQQYYIFHKTLKVVQNSPTDLDVLNDVFYYSKIDMSLNEGNGKVIEKNVPIYAFDSLMNAEISAVKHANGIDWWIVTPHKMLGKYYIFLLTESGITDTLIQTIETQIGTGEDSGTSIFSSDGVKYIRYNPIDDIDIFNFNRETGVFSNHKHVALDEFLSNGAEFVVARGVAVSPNNRYLYVSAHYAVYQYDLEATDIAGSQVLLDTFDGFVDPDFPAGVSFYAMQLGPDCRIYINSPSDVSYLHVIKYPDRAGTACELVQHGLELPSGHNFSMPYFPNYRLGTEYVYPCDSTINLPLTSATQPPVYVDKSLILSPNPCYDVLRIALPVGLDERGAVVTMTNMLGQMFEVSATSEGMGALVADVSGLVAGVYVCRVAADGREFVHKVVVF